MVDPEIDSNLTNNIKYGTVVGLGCTESSYLHHAVASIKDFEDPSYPALLLFLQYLTQLEGPLWRQIRGQGFAYSYDAVPRPNEGLLYFTLFKSSNVVAAYKEAQLIIVRNCDRRHRRAGRRRRILLCSTNENYMHLGRSIEIGRHLGFTITGIG